jgi:hypothetical protein
VLVPADKLEDVDACRHGGTPMVAASWSPPIMPTMSLADVARTQA